MHILEQVAPAEDVGRDTLSRYDMQFQAAAYAALEILEGKDVERVFCDYHDDFVVQKIINGQYKYHFYQVKTKKKLNDQWSSNDIFALHKRVQAASDAVFSSVRNSFAGKLLRHCINFSDACLEVTLLSNIYFDDKVEKIIEELKNKKPISKHAQFLVDNFSAVFNIEPSLNHEATSTALSKLSLAPAVDYIHGDRSSFSNSARAAIFKYSEIDLTQHETTEIANGLADLAYEKSRAEIKNIPKDKLEDLISIDLDDLLNVLSISRASYDALLSGEDPKALKTASIIQRWLKDANASDDMVEYASHQKVNWDIWLREARHIYSQLNLNVLLTEIDSIYKKWAQSGLGFDFLGNLLNELSGSELINKFPDLTPDLLFGAIGSVVVRLKSR